MASKHVVFWSVAGSVFLIDRLSKLLVLAYLPFASSFDLGPIALTHIRNTGTFFGFGEGAGVLLGVFAALVCIYIAYEYRRHPLSSQPLFALVFAGALGNLIDRLMYGAVIDFIDLRVWPVFNIADAAITVAIGVLLYASWREKKDRR